MKPSVVWVVNAGSHMRFASFKDAEQYGELKVLTEGKVNVFAVDNLVEDIVPVLDKGADKEDFVLLSGYGLTVAIVVHWFLKNFGFCKMLLWEANNRKYKAITFKDFEAFERSI